MKPAALLALFLLALACGRAISANDPPALWIDVPYVEQAKDGCGSAVISMLLQYWAKQKGQNAPDAADVAHIQELLYSPRQHGIPASAMENYFRQQGYRALAFRGEWSDLQNHVGKGRPLIVSLAASGARKPLHYAVVVGLDASRGYVFLNDPARGKMLRLSREGFQTEWDSANRWTLLAVPAGDD